MYDLQPESKHITLFKLQLRISNRIRVSCSEVDEPRACYTELSKSGREKQIWCINAHIHIPYHAEAEAPKLWPPDVKSRLFGKDPDAGKDWGQEEKGETEDEMVGMHHWLSGHDLGQTLRDSEGQGSLACCCPWGRKELDTF